MFDRMQSFLTPDHSGTRYQEIVGPAHAVMLESDAQRSQARNGI